MSGPLITNMKLKDVIYNYLCGHMIPTFAGARQHGPLRNITEKPGLITNSYPSIPPLRWAPHT
jgi:hypothetical protein